MMRMTGGRGSRRSHEQRKEKTSATPIAAVVAGRVALAVGSRRERRIKKYGTRREADPWRVASPRKVWSFEYNLAQSRTTTSVARESNPGALLTVALSPEPGRGCPGSLLARSSPATSMAVCEVDCQRAMLDEGKCSAAGLGPEVVPSARPSSLAGYSLPGPSVNANSPSRRLRCLMATRASIRAAGRSCSVDRAGRRSRRASVSRSRSVPALAGRGR